MTEYVRGPLEGTMHRLDGGHRTGVMWGPSVDGHWYASRSQVGDGETFKFTEWKHADAFLRAGIASQGRVFTGHLRYGFTAANKIRNLEWHHDPVEAHAEAGETPHELVAEPCTCSEPPAKPKGRARRKFAIPAELAAMPDDTELTSTQVARMLGIRQATITDWWRKQEMWSRPVEQVKINPFGQVRVTTAAELRDFIERRNNA